MSRIIVGMFSSTYRQDKSPSKSLWYLSPMDTAEAGRKGGLARAESLSAARRKEIAEKAVAARERKRAKRKKEKK